MKMSKERVVNNISSKEAKEKILKFVEIDGNDQESDINYLFRDDSVKLEIKRIDSNSDNFMQ